MKVSSEAGSGTSLAVQWLRLCLPMQGILVQSLAGELRSHMPCGQKAKTSYGRKIIINLIKALKIVHVKKINVLKKMIQAVHAL